MVAEVSVLLNYIVRHLVYRPDIHNSSPCQQTVLNEIHVPLLVPCALVCLRRMKKPKDLRT